MLKPVGCDGPSEGRGEMWGSEPRPLCLFGPAELPLFISVTARGRACLPGLKSELVCPPSLLLLFSQPLAAAVCHLNNKCRRSPDLLRGLGLWCILILPHGTPFQGPSLIWIKEVEFENSQCFTWIQIASIYCSELWNSH